MKRRSKLFIVAMAFGSIAIVYALLTAFSLINVSQQEYNQNFKVQNYQKVPLEGCRLINKDSLTTITDHEGKCSLLIKVPDQIIFKMRGYQIKSISITKKYKKELVVKLTPIKPE